MSDQFGTDDQARVPRPGARLVRRQRAAEGRPGRLLLRAHRERHDRGRVRRARTAGVDGQPSVAATAVRRRSRRPLVAEEYGGLGAPVWQDEIVEEVQSTYGVSTKVLAIALEMLPPVLFRHGTHEQRLQYLPPCCAVSRGGANCSPNRAQGRTSPAPGRPRRRLTAAGRSPGRRCGHPAPAAVTSRSLVARTDPAEPRHAGLSCFALDMSRPGVDVRPLRQMSGAYHFNEVFLDDVFVPETDLIGRLGDGLDGLADDAGKRTGCDRWRNERSFRGAALGPRRPDGPRRRAGGSSMVGGCLHARASDGPDQDADVRRGRRTRRRSAQQAALLGARPTHSRHRDQDPGSRRHAHRRCRRRTLDRAPPVRARAPNRRWHRRDPAQRHRRTWAGTPARAHTDRIRYLRYRGSSAEIERPRGAIRGEP